MTKKVGDIDCPVTEVELGNQVTGGIYLKSLGEDMVPLQEEHQARLERGIRIDEWSEMPEFEKALIIAVRRNVIAMKNIMDEAIMKDARNK